MTIAFASSLAMSAKPAPALHAIRCSDKPGSNAVRAATRAAHLSYMTDDSILFGGPTRSTDDGSTSGSLLIRSSQSAEETASFLAEDPYVKAGLFESVETRRWVRGMTSGTPLPNDLFAVWCVDRPASKQLRSETRPQHLDWWRNAGRKGMIGPFPADDGDGAVGSLIVCEGESVEEVRQWARTDPYAIVGLFQYVDVLAVKKVIEEGKVVL